MMWMFAPAAVLGFFVGYDRLRPRTEQSGTGEFICVAVLLILLRFASSAGEAALVGAGFAVGYSGCMLWRLKLPVPISVLLCFSQILVWTLFALGAWHLRALPFPLRVASIACAGTALFWLEWTLLPLWGTAQNFVSSSPKSPAFIALFGTAGGVWITLCYSGIYAQLFSLMRPGITDSLIIQIAAWCIGFFVFLRALEALLFRDKFKTLRVATFGWANAQWESSDAILAAYQEAAREASEKGSRLLVTPEAAVQVNDLPNFRVTLCTLAERYNLALAVGYFDSNQNQNCICFVSAQGEVVGRYVKTHLVPMMENYMRGQGDLATMDVDGVKVGGVICQDDNFPDVARKYARAGVQLLTVPTNDWKKVKDIHFANHLWRALEFRFALARATSQGISALTSADGKVKESSDHFEDKTRLLVADVRVGSGKPTLYARLGDWFPVICGVAAVCALIWAR